VVTDISTVAVVVVVVVVVVCVDGAIGVPVKATHVMPPGERVT
jgi:hypothetical protein